MSPPSQLRIDSTTPAQNNVIQLQTTDGDINSHFHCTKISNGFVHSQLCTILKRPKKGSRRNHEVGSECCNIFMAVVVSLIMSIPGRSGLIFESIRINLRIRNISSMNSTIDRRHSIGLFCHHFMKRKHRVRFGLILIFRLSFPTLFQWKLFLSIEFLHLLSALLRRLVYSNSQRTLTTEKSQITSNYHRL